MANILCITVKQFCRCRFRNQFGYNFGLQFINRWRQCFCPVAFCFGLVCFFISAGKRADNNWPGPLPWVFPKDSHDLEGWIKGLYSQIFHTLASTAQEQRGDVIRMLKVCLDHWDLLLGTASAGSLTRQKYHGAIVFPWSISLPAGFLKYLFYPGILGQNGHSSPFLFQPSPAPGIGLEWKLWKLNPEVLKVRGRHFTAKVKLKIVHDGLNLEEWILTLALILPVTVSS